MSRLGEKQLQFQLMSNAVEKSILWRMKRPSVDCLVDSQSQFCDPEDTPSQGEALGSQVKTTAFAVIYLTLPEMPEAALVYIYVMGTHNSHATDLTHNDNETG